MPRKSGVMIIAVTGTPGAGKTKFAESLSRETGLIPIEVNDIVEEKRLFSGVDENGSKIVKMQELKKELKALEKAAAGSGQRGVLLVGHLLADLKLDYDVAIVVRAKLTDLVSRLEARGYPKDKVRENLVSESIDYCGVQAGEKSKEMYEVETEADKHAAASYVKGLLSGRAAVPPSLPEINKMEEMLEIVYEGNTYGL